MCKLKIACIAMLLHAGHAQTQITKITGPAGSGQYGENVIVLTNGNYVVSDPFYDEGVIGDAGAVHLYNGITHALISTLKGSSSNDQIGGGPLADPIVVLSNGNFLVRSLYWDNGTATDAGAVTWVNGTTGLSGVVSSSNSLVGGSTNDQVGRITLLNNGNYLVVSPDWDNGTTADAGAVTWCNGNTGSSGNVSSVNSLVGSSANDHIGEVKVLSNGNYLIISPDWTNGALTNAGAVTWANGASGITGMINSGNSLVGNTSNGRIGGSGIIELTNGNFVVSSQYWDNGAVTDAGAVTFGNGATGVTGIVNSGNSLVGSKANDQVGYYVIPLNGDNYVVGSLFWDNGSIADAGAVTLCNGLTGTTGIVSGVNSLIGNETIQRVGQFITPLVNGNYVVSTPAIGTITWCDGSAGITGIINSGNSFYGHTNGTITPLSNGNYVVASPEWENKGAVTWCDGTKSTTGLVSSSNSLVGSKNSDGVGLVIPLANGNYVVCSPGWDNGSSVDAGAATWGDSETGIAGLISNANSLIGKASDNIGFFGAIALPNGNYLVCSPMWANGTNVSAGAVTWGNGATGISGMVTSSNSLVGTMANDLIGTVEFQSGPAIIPLSNSNYLVASSHWQGMGPASGAVTWGNGAVGISGPISSANSLVGGVAFDDVGMGTIKPLSDGNYLIATWGWNNGDIVDAGAITWGNGATGVQGPVNINNSLVGSAPHDVLGDYSLTELGNGSYVIKSGLWDNGTITDAGAVTWMPGGTIITGNITSCNSVMGNNSSGWSMNFKYNSIHEYLLVGHPSENMISIFKPTGMTPAVHLDSVSTNVAVNTPTPLIANSGCHIIATITPNGAHPVRGAVNAKIWLEDTVPVHKGHPFAARHYEITPSVNASTANGKLTLYFTQQDFNDFNSYSDSTLKLPANQDDSGGIANLRIGIYHGTSSDRTGLPATYPDSIKVIDPGDSDILWNSSLDRWEISFDVTGFSGFTVHTYSPLIPPLPLTLLEFSGQLINNDAVLSWKTTDEINTVSFDIERSIDGRTFVPVGTVAAAGQPGIHLYNFTDVNISSLGVPVVYYRLKMKDIDGRFTHSGIVRLETDNKINVVFYPNPVRDYATLTVTVNEPAYLQVRIIDNIGSVIRQEQWNVHPGNSLLPLNVNTLAKGLYYLELKGENINERIKFIKL